MLVWEGTCPGAKSLCGGKSESHDSPITVEFEVSMCGVHV
jgi:hypothetical protein